jgi:hypothetical protein
MAAGAAANAAGAAANAAGAAGLDNHRAGSVLLFPGPMKSILVSILKHFRGRRVHILFVAGASLLAIALFSIFPPEPLTPLASTGGGNISRGVAAPRVASPASAKPARSRRYLTLNPGETVDLSPGPVSFGDHPRLLRRVPFTWIYLARDSGHTSATVGQGRAKRQVYIFVSPTPSRQVSREDIDWYKTQFGTGTANCGPALVSMALLWARGIDISVQAVRDEIGYPYEDGSTSFDDLRDSLARHRVVVRSPELAEEKDLMSVVDRGHLALVLIRSGQIEKVRGDPSNNMVGRYYDDDEGHYVIVKGYSLDRRYFVVYDPYPVDWESNSLRYGDDISMIGKNRYYSAQQLFDAMKTRMVLEIFPS